MSRSFKLDCWSGCLSPAGKKPASLKLQRKSRWEKECFAKIPAFVRHFRKEKILSSSRGGSSLRQNPPVRALWAPSRLSVFLQIMWCFIDAQREICLLLLQIKDLYVLDKSGYWFHAGFRCYCSRTDEILRSSAWHWCVLHFPIYTPLIWFLKWAREHKQ